MHKIYKSPFAEIYDCYVAKIEKKQRTKEELDIALGWLTGLDKNGLTTHIKSDINLEDFFNEIKLNPNVSMITGSICGVKIQEIEDPLMKKIRYMDKIVDELAKGKALEKICRSSSNLVR